LYRVNALLLADQIRREVAVSIALGHEDLCPSENLLLLYASWLMSRGVNHIACSVITLLWYKSPGSH
jgi:hypothetical protein